MLGVGTSPTPEDRSRLRRRRVLARLTRDQDGASAREYALLAAVIGGGMISAATRFGNGLSSAHLRLAGCNPHRRRATRRRRRRVRICTYRAGETARPAGPVAQPAVARASH